MIDWRLAFGAIFVLGASSGCSSSSADGTRRAARPLLAPDVSTNVAEIGPEGGEMRHVSTFLESVEVRLLRQRAVVKENAA
jgi:hypothetical protein